MVEPRLRGRRVDVLPAAGARVLVARADHGGRRGGARRRRRHWPRAAVAITVFAGPVGGLDRGTARRSRRRGRSRSPSRRRSSCRWPPRTGSRRHTARTMVRLHTPEDLALDRGQERPRRRPPRTSHRARRRPPRRDPLSAAPRRVYSPKAAIRRRWESVGRVAAGRSARPFGAARHAHPASAPSARRATARHTCCSGARTGTVASIAGPARATTGGVP